MFKNRAPITLPLIGNTASVYQNEQLLGKHFKHLLHKKGLKREDVFLTSKLSPKNHGYKEAEESFLKSLTDVGSSYIDLYLIHWPGKSKLRGLDPKNREFRKESWKALEDMHKKGLAKAIGVSNYTIDHLKEMESYAEIMPAVNQVEFHPHLYQKELLDYCGNKGIQLQAYSSLGVGELIKDPLINQIAKKYDKSASQVLLRWGLQHGIGVIPKSTNPQHIKENFDVFNFVITDEDMALMNGMNINKHYCWDPSTVV
ncbi:uncharacterized oxidoreductase YtbE-like isoform X2 [Rhopilema esculentum]|uniref:uncharacterized oxidoreductase YtbE-like isoform X2 n=1 Tax=Rhopilema esculentum TaxID=499914 RepID=UPI0031E1A760